MAFEKSIHLTDCKYRYTISPNVKKFTLRDTTFVQNKIGNYELHRLLEKVPNSGEGFPLKITINKEESPFLEVFFTWRFRVNVPFILVFNKGLD